MKITNSFVHMTANELQAMFRAYDEQFGHAEARNWLDQYAPTVKLSEGAISWFHTVMTAH